MRERVPRGGRTMLARCSLHSRMDVGNVHNRPGRRAVPGQRGICWVDRYGAAGAANGKASK